jgi:hypothetical protein|nr:MAG TPA: cold inducible protein [Caudoviricetes sp.]
MSDKRLIDANALHKRIEMNLRASNPFTIEECCYKDALNSVDEAPTIDPETLRPVAHWEEIPNSYVSCAGKNAWCVPATRCSNPECGEVNPCGLKTPFCPMCGSRMEDVPYDDDAV